MVNIEPSRHLGWASSMKGLAILVIAAVAGATVVGLVEFATTPAGSSESATSSSFPTWQVVRDNVTVTGPMAEEVACSFFGFDCPTIITSIADVKLVEYEGTYYYVHNMTFGTNPAPSTTITSTQADGRVVSTISVGQDQSSLAVTLWFTNSTVYCISPSTGPSGKPWPTELPACP